MATKAKKRKLKISKPKSKLYLPFTPNNVGILFVSDIEKGNILSSNKVEGYTKNILPNYHQTIPPRVDDSFKYKLENTLETLREGGDDLDSLLKIFIVENKLVDHFPTVQNIENLETTISTLERANIDTPIENIDSTKSLILKLRSLKTVVQRNNVQMEAVSTQISAKNDPIVYSNPVSSDRLSMDTFILPNRKVFQNYVNTHFIDMSTSVQRNAIKKWNVNTSSYIDIYPFPHQKFVSDYLSDKTPYRGLLLYHGLGSGKSGASILIGEGFIDRRIVILLPASIRNNYVGEIQTFGEMAYKKNFHWTFVKLAKSNRLVENKYIEIMKSKGINPGLYSELIKNEKTNNIGEKERGIWMIDHTRDTPNFNSLSELNQKSLEKQINIMFNYKYTICHYNAGQYTITKILEKLVPQYKIIYSQLFGQKKISKLTNNDRDRLLAYIYNQTNNIENPFSNKVLIVDEIHNLTSSMAGSSYNAARLYELIMRAKNLKIVLLSGTPVINTSYELALMYNMLKGFIKVYTITIIKDSGLIDHAELDNLISKSLLVDRYEIKNKTIKIIRNPTGFVNKFSESGEYIGVMRSNENDISDIEFIESLRELLLSKNYSFTLPHVSRSTIFPDILDKRNFSQGIMLGNPKYIEIQQSIFSETYISQSSNQIINGDNFMNRIIGLTSFYNEISSPEGEEDIFPDKIYADESETEVIMSNYQFIEYASKRRIERELENSMKMKKKKDADDKIPNLFKVFTRQKGLFVFPPNISRPKPPKKNRLDDVQVNSDHIDIKEMLKNIVKKHKEDPYTQINLYIKSLDKEKQSIAMEIFQHTFKTDDQSSSIEDYKEYLETLDFGEEDDIFSYPDTEDQLKYSEQCIRAIDSLSSENLSVNSSMFNLSILSPKYVKMLENINNTPGLVFMYSQFRTVEGIEIFARALVENGYTRITIRDGQAIFDNDIVVGKKVRYLENESETCNTYTVNEINGSDITINRDGIDKIVKIEAISLCKFSLWTGSEDAQDRNTILSLYNSLDNMWGHSCLLLMTTQSGAEGISLKFVRQVHIMEPYWNNVRINQVIGRARRIKSHMELPIKDRNVKIFNYIIKYSDSQKSGSWVETLDSDIVERVKSGEENAFNEEDYVDQDDELEDVDTLSNFKKFGMSLSEEIGTADGAETSDENLVEISIKKEVILTQFLDLMKKASVDCVYNRIDNLRSNPDLGKLECYPTDSTFNISDTPFIYEIATNDIISESTSSSKRQTKIVKLKRLIIPFRIPDSNDLQLKFIINLPQGIDTLADAPDNTPIYDYYIYKGINPNKINLTGQFINIGYISRREGTINPIFKKTFIDSIPIYKNIQISLNKLTSRSGKTLEEVKSDLLEQHRKSISKKWTCIACNEVYNDSLDNCPKETCAGITKEVSLSHSQKTQQSVKSTKSAKLKKRRRKKKSSV